MSEEILCRIELKIDKLEEKLDKLNDKMAESNVIQGQHEITLKDHTHRSHLLEERTDLLFAEIEPLKAHANQMAGIYKFFGFLGIIATIIGVALKVLGKV